MAGARGLQKPVALCRALGYAGGMSLELKIILVAVLVLIGSHLFLWGFIKRKLREAEARLAAENAAKADASAPDETPPTA